MIVGSKLLKASVQKPNLEGVFKGSKTPLMAFQLSKFSTGVYLITTSTATSQRADAVLLGEAHPKEGYLIKIER